MGEKEEISTPKAISEKEGGGGLAPSETPSNNKINFPKDNWIICQLPIPNLRERWCGPRRNPIDYL